MKSKWKSLLVSGGCGVLVATCCIFAAVFGPSSPEQRAAREQARQEARDRVTAEREAAEQAAEDQRQEEVHEAQDRATAASVDLVSHQDEIRTALGAIGSNVRRRRWTQARVGLDELSPRFDPILDVTLNAAEETVEVRQFVATVEELRGSFTGHRTAIDGFEMEVFGAVYADAYNPPLAGPARERVLRRTGRRFRITADEVDAIMIRLAPEIDRRREARRAGLERRCGPQPVDDIRRPQMLAGDGEEQISIIGASAIRRRLPRSSGSFGARI